MGNLSSLEVSDQAEKPAESAVVLVAGMEIYLVLSGLVDFDAERKRLEKEKAKVEKDVQKFSKKLSNPGFLSKAAPEVVEKDKAKLASLEELLGRISDQLAELG